MGSTTPFRTILLYLLASHGAQAANGIIYYNRFVPNTPATIRRIGGDAVGDQVVSLNLPEPTHPTLSRSGRFLLATSRDPIRPFMLTRNVYLFDLTSGTSGRITTYFDEVVQDGLRFQRDLGNLIGNTTISAYTIHAPNHKALSPDGTRVVVMDLFRSGAVNQGGFGMDGFDPNELTISSGRLPQVDVFNVADALPSGPFVYLSPQPRTGFNQGGDGVDWHPSRNEVVACISSDIPAESNIGLNSMEGTLLAVFAASGTNTFIRKLTNPVGRRNLFGGLGGILDTVGMHDYSPAISPNGQGVAFLRHAMRMDAQTGLVPQPCLCSIHIIRYDGTNERQVLALNEGMWATKVSWSPDGAQLVFDLAPQLVLNGLPALIGDVGRSQLFMVNADGSNPRLFHAGPAAYPHWGVDLAPPPPSVNPALQIARTGSALRLRLDGVPNGRPFRLEGTTNLGVGWATLLSTTSSGDGHLIDVTPDPQTRAAFYRVVVP
ncbi:MAG: TolB family protein [Verrucomicrobiales bacterium]